MLAMSLFVGTARTGSLIWTASPSTPKQTGMQTHTTKDKQGLFFGHLQPTAPHFASPYMFNIHKGTDLHPD